MSCHIDTTVRDPHRSATFESHHSPLKGYRSSIDSSFSPHCLISEIRCLIEFIFRTAWRTSHRMCKALRTRSLYITTNSHKVTVQKIHYRKHHPTQKSYEHVSIRVFSNKNPFTSTSSSSPKVQRNKPPEYATKNAQTSTPSKIGPPKPDFVSSQWRKYSSLPKKYSS
jgi:hypothetical protein